MLHSSFARRLVALVFLLLVPLLGGCVYLRLLQLKNQFADFDRHFAVDASSGLKLSFKSPVLLDADMAFLGMKSTLRERSGAAERWTLRWQKQPAPADPEGAAFQQSLEFIFVNQRLTTLMVPERFFVFFPKNVLIAGLRAMGHMKVDREKRSATTEVQDGDKVGETPLLTVEALTRTLGAPNKSEDAGTSPEWHYTFLPTPECAGSGAIDLVFAIDPAAGVVRRVRGKLIFGTFDFSYPDAAATASK